MPSDSDRDRAAVRDRQCVRHRRVRRCICVPIEEKEDQPPAG